MPIRIDRSELGPQKIQRGADEIAKSCFWDYEMTGEKVLRIAKEGTEQEKLWLIRRVIENSLTGTHLAWFFDHDELVSLMDQIDIDSLRTRFAKRTLASMRSLFGGRSIPAEMPELTWKNIYR